MPQVTYETGSGSPMAKERIYSYSTVVKNSSNPATKETDVTCVQKYNSNFSERVTTKCH